MFHCLNISILIHIVLFSLFNYLDYFLRINFQRKFRLYKYTIYIINRNKNLYYFWYVLQMHSKNFYTDIKNKFLQQDTGCVSKSKTILLNIIGLRSIRSNFEEFLPLWKYILKKLMMKWYWGLLPNNLEGRLE